MRLNVKLPGQPSKEAPHLTRFQTELPPHWQGTTLLGLSVEPSDTVAALKAKVAAASGSPAPQWLRKGGVKGGTVLQDSATLEQCGLAQDMDVWEHLWADSATNQEQFEEEYAKVLSYVSTQRDFLNSRAA